MFELDKKCLEFIHVTKLLRTKIEEKVIPLQMIYSREKN